MHWTGVMCVLESGHAWRHKSVQVCGGSRLKIGGGGVLRQIASELRHVFLRL